MQRLGAARLPRDRPPPLPRAAVAWARGGAQDMTGSEAAGAPARPGCGLGGNLDVAVCRAEWLLHQGAFQVGLPYP